jgi:adiponectin receptor
MVNGWDLHNQRMALSYFIGLGLLNGSGAAIYGARIPERWYPGAFDVVGASHQIMHVLVMCGALSHSIGLVKAFDFWHSLRGANRALGSDWCRAI